MKKLTLLLIAWIVSASLFAQELTVKSFSESKSDLSARTYPRMDNNDNPCALVKVQLASAGAVFEGSVMGGVQYKTSEYWVYMPKGSKRLTVKLEGYLPLPVEFEPLESSTTYVLTISGVVNNGGQTQEVRTRTGWIIIDSEPQGASVYINNEYVGNTPLDNCKQAYGTYSYRLEMPNYHSQSGSLELNASRYEKTFKLAPAFGSIAISGISGATVLLDGKQTGKTTPCTLTEVASGQHTITLQKAKYAPQQLTAQVQDGQTTSLTANLDARFYIEAAGQFGMMNAVGASLGCYIHNVNIEADYYMGISKSEEVFWNDKSGSKPYSYTYKPTFIGAKVGYGFVANKHFCITPQLGLGAVSVSGSEVQKGDNDPDATKGYAMNMSFGARVDYLLNKHFGFNVTPEYGFAISKSNLFDRVSAVSDKVKGFGSGFNVRIGLFVNF